MNIISIWNHYQYEHYFCLEVKGTKTKDENA